jgi:hypothetical protein
MTVTANRARLLHDRLRRQSGNVRRQQRQQSLGIVEQLLMSGTPAEAWKGVSGLSPFRTQPLLRFDDHRPKVAEMLIEGNPPRAGKLFHHDLTRAIGGDQVAHPWPFSP